MEQDSHFQNQLTKLKQLFYQDSSLILTAAYIVLIGIGMIFSYQFYHLWGIDILKYAELTDFLLAPFADTIVFVFTSISLGLVWVAMILNDWLEAKYPRAYKILNMGMSKESKYYKAYLSASYIGSAFLYVHFAATVLGIFDFYSIKKGKGKKVEVQFQSKTESRPEVFVLLGKTTSFVFLVDTGLTKVQAIPIEGNIASLSYLEVDSAFLSKEKKFLPFQ
jgi:hypothetical protein